MKLETSEWKEYTIGDYFDVYLSSGDLKIDDCEPGNIPLVSSGSTNNGIVGYIDNKGDGKAQIFKANNITVDMFCNAFYQSKDFYAVSHGRVNVLSPKFKCNLQIGLFICSVIKKEQFKYSYGRAVYSSEIARMIVKLPAKFDGTPDWKYMEDYIKSLHHKPLTTKNINNTTMRLNAYEWEYFLLKDICTITMGNKMDYSAMSIDDPTVNFVGRSADNNGVAGKVDLVTDDKGNIVEPYKAGCITVALGGSLGSSYLQVEDFYTSQNVSVLEFEEGVSDSAKLFITTCIMNESKYKYFPFGRELNTHIRTDFGFTLPIQRNSNGEPIIDDTHKYSKQGFIPDWQWMENYIKSLPYGDRM